MNSDGFATSLKHFINQVITQLIYINHQESHHHQNLTYKINIIPKDNTSLSNKYTIYKSKINARAYKVNIQNMHELDLPLCRNAYNSGIDQITARDKKFKTKNLRCIKSFLQEDKYNQTQVCFV